MGNCINIFACVRNRRNKKKQKLNQLSHVQDPTTSSTLTTTLNNFTDQNPPIPPPRTKMRANAMLKPKTKAPVSPKSPFPLAPKAPAPLALKAPGYLAPKAPAPLASKSQATVRPKDPPPLPPKAPAPLAPKLQPSPLKATTKSASRPKTVPKPTKKIGPASLRPKTAPIWSMTDQAPHRASTPLKTPAPLMVTTTLITSRSFTVPITTKTIGLSPLRPVTPPSKLFEKQAPALTPTKPNEQTSPKEQRSGPVLVKWTKKRLPVSNPPIVPRPPKSRIPLRSRLPRIQPPPEPSEATSQKWWVSLNPPSPTLTKSETPLNIPILQKNKTPPKAQSPKSSTPLSPPPSPKFDVN